MCFTRTNNIKPQKATKDILVHKIICQDGTGWLYNLKFDGKTEPWLQGFVYTEPDFLTNAELYQIEENAFHSFNANIEIKDIPHSTWIYDIIVKMYIPKGTWYMTDGVDYVSESLYYPVQKMVIQKTKLVKYDPTLLIKH